MSKSLKFKSARRQGMSFVMHGTREVKPLTVIIHQVAMFQQQEGLIDTISATQESRLL